MGCFLKAYYTIKIYHATFSKNSGRVIEVAVVDIFGKFVVSSTAKWSNNRGGRCVVKIATAIYGC